MGLPTLHGLPSTPIMTSLILVFHLGFWICNLRDPSSDVYFKGKKNPYIPGFGHFC